MLLAFAVGGEIGGVIGAILAMPVAALRKKFKVTGRHGPKRAATRLEEGIAAFEKHKKQGH